RAVHVTSKLCSGPSHPEPTRLAIDRQHWNFHQSGRYQGKPVARCKACQNWAKLVHKDGPHGLTAAATVLPYLKELLERCGSYDQLQKRYHVLETTARDLLTGTQTRLQRKTAQRILAALAEQRRLDRNGHATTDRYRSGLITAAVREHKMMEG